MVKQNLIGRLAAVLVLAFGLVWSAAVPSFAAACTAGTYNYRQALDNACAWGHIERRNSGAPLFNPGLRVDIVLRDTSVDGRCARWHFRTRVSFAPDQTDEWSVCGQGESRPIQFTRFYNGSNFLQAWSVRVCAVNCTDWRDYQP
jgi:hypothetical protein